MTLLDENSVRMRARARERATKEPAEEILAKLAGRRADHYDIFLSQTTRDAEIVLGVYGVLSDLGYKVFCDWIASPDTDRKRVTPENAERIRAIMSISDTLLFLDTENADQSLWMCWELGWFDGGKGPVAVLPVLKGGERTYRGREFLGLYPYVELDDAGELKVVRPVVPTSSGFMMFEAPNYRSFDLWRNGSRDFMRPRGVDPFAAYRR